MSSINLSSCIKEKALEIGYDLCGMTPVNLIEEYSSLLDERTGDFPDVSNSACNHIRCRIFHIDRSRN